MDSIVSGRNIPIESTNGRDSWRPAQRDCYLWSLSSLVLLAWFCSSCVPLRFTTSPGATGRIVDATTHAPVTGAEVVVSRSTYPPSSADGAFTNSRPPTVMSSEMGRFNVPLERRLDLYFVPVDIFPRFGLLVVKRQGYRTACVPFWSRSVVELGDIQLKTGP
jgi:hypothetical protein